MTSERTSDVPVLVVGGGPAGLTAALLLARHGVGCVVVDKRPDGSPLPRARGVHARAMEILRVCGVEPDMRAAELPITPGAEWRSGLTGPAIREDVPSAGGATGVSPCEGLSLSQDVFEVVLRDHLARHTAADLRRGVALESFAASADGVDAELLDVTSGVRSRVRARWMIAADGARSPVRQRLGIGMTGPDDLGRHTMIAFRADLGAHTAEPPRGIYFLTATGAALIPTHPDHRWVLSTPGRDAPDAPAATVREVLGLPDLAVEVLASGGWTAAAQSADRYRAGPVFLVGDAAHRFPPAGATGVSTAMHDAHNLAWKLAAVLHGHAGEALLDTYAAEREPVGWRNASETGAAWARVFGSDGIPFAGRSLAQIDMGHQYRSTAVIPDGSPDADPPGADYAPTAAPGCRAPHLWMATPAGPISTIDLFDRRFVLLSSDPDDGWRVATEKAAGRLGVPLDHRPVREPGWAPRYGVTAGGAVLVRPDGHVAWRCPAAPGAAAHDVLVDALAAVTGRQG